MRFRTVPVLTNTVPVGAQRGPGENQLVTVIEPMIDQAARQLNIDRFDIRIINAPDSNAKFGKDQGPVTSAFLKDALAKLRTFSNWEERKKRSGQKNGTKVTGIGIGQGYHSAGSNGFDGLLRITPDGKLHVHTGVGNLGTHSWASTARVAPDLLNVSWDNVGHRARRYPARPALQLAAGGQPHGLDPVAHHVCRGDGHEGQAHRHRRPDAGRQGGRV